jgi:hypothetical protein
LASQAAVGTGKRSVISNGIRMIAGARYGVISSKRTRAAVTLVRVSIA